MRAVIIVSGGVVQEVLADQKLDYIIIDQDVQDEDEACQLRDTDGWEFPASITEGKTSASVETVEHYYNQIPAM